MKNTKEFLTKIVNDEGFAKKFENIEDFESLKKKAKDEGYDISKEEYNKLRKESANQLSDKNLEMTAGGSSLDEFAADFKEGFNTTMGIANTVVSGAGSFAKNLVGNIFGLFK